MSGSGGGSGGGERTWRPVKPTAGDGQEDVGADRCLISERTILNSPSRAVVARLRVGDELDVELQTTPLKKLVIRNDTGEIAGAITSRRLVEFIQCIEAGFSYRAIVCTLTGGRVEIEIRPQ